MPAKVEERTTAPRLLSPVFEDVCRGETAPTVDFRKQIEMGYRVVLSLVPPAMSGARC